MRRILLFAAASALFGSHGPRTAVRLCSFPAITLWAWERHEDLRRLDPSRYAVAYLAETIFIGDKVSTVARRQPLLVAPGAKLIAVVRIEAHSGHANLSDPGLPGIIAGIISAWGHDGRTAAVQVDFDATQSQRAFYGQMLRELRSRLPAQMPLSITALASWCAFDDWIGQLPVDEAVPMFFRMGPEHPPAQVSGWQYPIHEPFCRGVAGVSTDEAWPELSPGTRLYMFHPRPWNPIALNNLEHSLGL
ncbi:MAG TPA: DUF3142 domain-containing protein [Candidatus Angelobacter sp.]|nr:DUF3142 domain-containing protein [Candidatus Angelobacter sp.]